MKKMIRYIIFVLLATTIACNKDALNKGPLNLYSDNTIWKDSALISRVVLQAYSSIHSIYDDAGNWMPCDITDEAKDRRSYHAANLINTGQYTSSTGIYNNIWQNTYVNVRGCNTVLSHLDEMPLSDAGKQQIKGEMLFLRALHYLDLYYIFGRFPIVDKVLSLDDELAIARGSDEDCITFMQKDLDDATALLPETYPAASLGRATKYAAIGMKCRLLLNHKDYNGAAAAAKTIIDRDLYHLFPDYEAMFYPENDDNVEVIFNKEFAGDQSGQIHNLDVYDNSRFFTGFGSVIECPTQNLVDQYLLTDGKPWDHSTLYDPAHPYINRDPRFQASIMYDGCTWMNISMDMKLGSAINPSTSSNTPTGYMLRKFLNPNYIFYGNNSNYQNCIMLRLAEIYLNYAECQLKLGNAEEARTYINLLRKRVQMPEVPAGQMDWDTYVRERTVELAFEGQRWNDIRRWGTGATMIGAQITAINIAVNNGARTYTRVSLEQRYFDPKIYYFPIPQTELQKYPAGKVLEQNPGWQ
ncbi:Starch-binding associating with outer membrane [Chitinophaga costaii]|uniref:Starch-binding associating with outer membrane n=1 Tax=Chitinophaga costaii TaxID=1335309 RepID=A0A1C4FD60_9BACT|nr:RagB/SusD family nutrient uptake outer membrane protein [Chitinophaga costaii]SCC53421.1 Starch-binding associating with outer membrane [Chitinophaga costaii]